MSTLATAGPPAASSPCPLPSAGQPAAGRPARDARVHLGRGYDASHPQPAGC